MPLSDQRDSDAVEAAAKALHEQLRLSGDPLWEDLNPLLQEDVRRWARATVEAYLAAAR